MVYAFYLSRKKKKIKVKIKGYFMKQLCSKRLIAIVVFVLMSITPYADAGVITVSLGNTASGLVDGDHPTVFPDLVGIQGGQPAPFDAGIGNELFGDPASVNWTFLYAAITDTIISASLTIGIADHDSMSSGNQLEAFSGDGSSLFTEMNTLFEGSGGSDGEYNVYTIDLVGFFADLADGSFLTALDIGGSGLQTALFGGEVTETANNGFHLIYSTLSITTEEITDPDPIPEPNILMLFVAALLGLRLFIIKRRR